MSTVGSSHNLEAHGGSGVGALLRLDTGAGSGTLRERQNPTIPDGEGFMSTRSCPHAFKVGDITVGQGLGLRMG